MVLVLLVAVGFGVAGPYGQSKQANSKNIHGFSSTATNALFPGGEGWRADGRTKVHQEEVNEGNVS